MFLSYSLPNHLGSLSLCSPFLFLSPYCHHYLPPPGSICPSPMYLSTWFACPVAYLPIPFPIWFHQPIIPPTHHFPASQPCPTWLHLPILFPSMFPPTHQFLSLNIPLPPGYICLSSPLTSRYSYHQPTPSPLFILSAHALSQLKMLTIPLSSIGQPHMHLDLLSSSNNLFLASDFSICSLLTLQWPW